MFHNINQNTDEWLELRAGKVTGSSISKIMAHSPKAFGEPAKKLAAEIATHQSGGILSHENYTNEHMKRGHEQEPIARLKYEDETFCNVDNGGFFDNGLTGCSPDGLVGGDGVIEIKSVTAYPHFKMIKRNDIDPAYDWQVAFNLRETGREWIDYISFCSEFPKDKQLFICRKTIADFEQKHEEMAARLIQFQALVLESKQLIKEAA